jgi:hypothetical protein
MEKRKMDDGSWLYFDPRGACRSYHYDQGVIQSVCRGLQLAALAPYVMEEGEAMLARAGRCIFMVDAYDSSRMEMGFQEAMTKWFKAHVGRVRVNMLFKSRLLEMAINIANLAIGMNSAKAYANVAEWEAVGGREVPGFKRIPWVTPPELGELVRAP